MNTQIQYPLFINSIKSTSSPSKFVIDTLRDNTFFEGSEFNVAFDRLIKLNFHPVSIKGAKALFKRADGCEARLSAKEGTRIEFTSL
jgi:hypothetical protein